MRHCCVTGLILALSSLPAVRAGEAKDLESLWKDLADADANRAYAAMWAFVRTPEKSIAFFERHLKPAVPPERKMVAQLIEELGHEKFAVRAKANGALEKLGDLVTGPLHEALRREQLVLEARQRVEKLIKGLRGPITSPERLRAIRAVEAIEYIGTPEARKLLQQIAQGAAGARLTVEAQEAVERLRLARP
jgi:hypothetical protein